jgi:hypothetical protein
MANLSVTGYRPQSFETADLNLACYLRCRGLEITDVRLADTRIAFSFLDSAELRQFVLEYANDGLVAVRSFCSTLRDLKALIRDLGAADRRNGHGGDA